MGHLSKVSVAFVYITKVNSISKYSRYEKIVYKDVSSIKIHYKEIYIITGNLYVHALKMCFKKVF